jgi:predicted CXXCH cytochrome family protein
MTKKTKRKNCMAKENTINAAPVWSRGYFQSLICTLRSLICALCAMLFVLCIFSLEADARVKGRCKTCHNVRGGHTAQPSISSVENDCLACHGRNPSGTENISTEGKSRFPQVLHHMQDNDLAGGNFYYVADSFNPDYSKGHNVVGISRPQNPPMDVPPGFMKDVLIPGGTGPAYWPNQKQLNCAGTWGCHGNRTIEDPFKSISGAHHEDDSIIDGSTVGKSYRFFYGIKGREHPDREYMATSVNHNGYKGSIDASGMDTISYLCGECHAKFHPNPHLGGKDEVGQAYDTSIWRRHPVDIAFNSVRGGFANSEYEGYVRYSLQAPVAYDKPTGREEAVDSSSVVMCLSCHRAHASPYPSILRWDYSNMIAGTGNRSGNGCFACHTEKGRH